jgi:hypothetical protein
MTQLEQSVSGNGIAGGVNGDFVGGSNAVPSGIVVTGGVLQHTPTPARSSIGFAADGSLKVGRISFSGTWQGSGQRRPLAGVNQRPRGAQVVLFTPAWGPATPQVANAVEVVLGSFPRATVGGDLTATVVGVVNGSTTPIPPDGAVLLATGAAGAKLQAEAPQDGKVTVRLILPDAWSSVSSALGGGPVLVRGGRPLFATGENFPAADLTSRQARAAVGQLADGRVILVAVDGGRPGSSVGMTSYELARTMASLGAQTAAGLGYGSNVTASWDAQLLDRSNNGARAAAVKEALLVQYAGVYALPPSAPALGKADAGAGEQLTYRISRPSQVTAVVTGPDGTSHPIDAGAREAGTYRFPFAGVDTEGTWHWTVTATDDAGRGSSADETFVYDATLTALAVPKAATATGLTVSFSLSRPASVALAVSAPNGTTVAAPAPVQLPAGTQSLLWDGTTATGANAPPGSYVATVTETSTVGTVAFHAAFRLRR